MKQINDYNENLKMLFQVVFNILVLFSHQVIVVIINISLDSTLHYMTMAIKEFLNRIFVIFL